MNAFADTMFSILLGWVRGVAQSLMRALSSPDTSGFFEWLGDHWLMLAIVLMLAGVILDYLVWLIRWKPYLLWKTWMRKIFRRVRGGVMGQKAFTKGYTDGISLDGLQDNHQEAPYSEQPYQEEPPQYAYSAAEYSPQEPEWTRRMPYQAPETVFSARVAAPISAEQPQTYQNMFFEEEFEQRQPQMTVGRQKRRSDKHLHGFAGAVNMVKSHLSAVDEENEVLDGLPPVISRDQAFHEPVYPTRGSNRGNADE